MGNTCFKPCIKTTSQEGDFQEVVVNGNQAKYIEKEIPQNLVRRNIPKYIPELSSGRVIDVYDGDTFTIASRVAYNPKLFQFQVRVNGIDTPEKRTHDENEKFVANIAKEFVKDKIMNKIIELHNVETDKYGRLLADVVYKGENIGEQLIKNRLAVEYDGGTKKCPDNWRSFYEGN